MSLTERSRAVLYHRLNDIIGDEEAVGEMLAHFPADEGDRPATESFVAAQISDVRTEIAELSGELRGEIVELRGDLRGEIAGLRGDLMTFVHAEVRSSMHWTLGFLVSSQAVLVAALAVFN